MKKFISMLLMLSMFPMTMTACAAEEMPNADSQSDNGLSIVLKIGSDKMLVNRTEKEIDPGRGTVPIIQNGRTLMPIRAIVEEIGGEVEWNEQEQAATLTCGDNVIVLSIGSDEALLNGEKQILDCEPVVINDRTMLPIRFVAESFDYDVSWNDNSQSITITPKTETNTAADTQLTEIMKGEYTVQELWLKNNDSRIYGELYLPSDNEEKYPVVILAHGFGSNHSYNNKYAEMLAQNGIACYNFDFCGGGPSSKSDGNMRSMSVLTEIENMKSVLSQIKEQEFCNGQIFLMGESQGGCVAAITAAQTKQDISGVILLYPAFVIPDDAKELYADASAIPETTTLFGMTVGRKYYEDALNLDIYDTIPEYTDDVLIIHGSSDSIVPISYSDKAVEVYKNAELVTIDGAGHGFNGKDAEYAGEQASRYIKSHLK